MSKNSCGRSFRLPFELDGDQQETLAFRLLLLAVRILLYPAFLLFVAVDRVSRQDKWYRAEAERMERREPFTDDDASRSLGLSPEETETWCLIRRVVAESIGVRADAIHPGDEFSDLMRMQFPLPDLRDFLLRIEKQLGRPIRMGSCELEKLAAEVTYLDFSTRLIETINCRPDAN